MNDFGRIKSLANRGEIEQALAECNRLLGEGDGHQPEVLRTRAYVCALKGDYAQAVQDREVIFDMRAGTIRDYYSAADHALSAGQYEKSASWFETVVRLGEASNETWFHSAALFLLAFAYMELGKYREARESLQKATEYEPGVAMPVPGICGTLDSNQLRGEISSRESASDKLRG